MKLGQLREAWGWYGTARLIADDTGDTELRARIRAQAAMLPYYYGDAAEAVRLAGEAQLLASRRNTAAAALGAAAEARALARLGQRTQAQGVLHRAQEIFESIDEGDSDDAFRFPEKRHLFYLSGALSYIGDLEEVIVLQDRALRLYCESQDGFVIDPTLMSLDRAMCMVLIGDASDGCHLAGKAIADLPGEHRTRIIWTRGHDVVRSVPPTERGLPAVSQLREVMDMSQAVTGSI